MPTVNFTPYESQTDFLTLNRTTENGGLAWVTSNAPESNAYVEKLEIDSASENITKTVDEINDENTGGAEIKVLIGNDDALQNVPLTFTVNGQNATTNDDSYVVGNMRLTAIDGWDNQSTSGVATISIGKKDDKSTIAAGTYNFTVTAPTANNNTVSDTFTLTVTDDSVPPQPPVPTKTLESISITTPPTKTAYTVGDVFNPAGMVVTATYSNGSTAEVSGYTTSPNTALNRNDTSITVSYTGGRRDENRRADYLRHGQGRHNGYVRLQRPRPDLHGQRPDQRDQGCRGAQDELHQQGWCNHGNRGAK